MRYGENPHQASALYASGSTGIANATQLQVKELGYNNLVDLDAAWQLICEFDLPASAIIKHTNPCGCATATTLVDSYKKAFAADPISAFGGEVDADTEIAKTFIEAIAAPSYTNQARSILASKKNLRLLELIAAGAGQMSRVDSVKFGASKAILPLENCVVASDAFFPFPDGLEAAADRLGLAMVLTGFHHFRH